jgi:hypothetical protein
MKCTIKGDHRDSYKYCNEKCYIFIITWKAMVRSFEVMSEKKLRLSESMVRILSVNCVIMNLYVLLYPPHRLKYLKKKDKVSSSQKSCLILHL